MRSTGPRNARCRQRRPGPEAEHQSLASPVASAPGGYRRSRDPARRGLSRTPLMIKRLVALSTFLAITFTARAEDKSPVDVTTLPGTKPLEMKGDIASELVAGVDRFLLKQIEKSVEG